MSEPTKKITIRQAKPNAADLEMLKSLLTAFHDIFAGYMPEDDDDEEDDYGEERLVDFDDDENAAKALRAVLIILLRGNLERCVWTLSMLMDPASYWSEYDVPLGIVDRINAAIAKAKGDK